MHKIIQLILVVVVVGLMASCRSTKRIQTAISKKDTTNTSNSPDSRNDSLQFIRKVYQAVQTNRIDFTTFTAKIKVNFEGSDGKKSDFNAFVRLKKRQCLVDFDKCCIRN